MLSGGALAILARALGAMILGASAAVPVAESRPAEAAQEATPGPPLEFHAYIPLVGTETDRGGDPGTPPTRTPTPSPTGILTTTFFDVGQGDAAWVHSTRGCSLVVDGGRGAARGSMIVGRLREAGVESVDAVVASHADRDHIEGLITVVEEMDVELFVHNGRPADTEVSRDLATAVAARAIPTDVARTGDAYSWPCGVTASILHPSSVGSDDNNASVVVRVTHGATALLFTGDADERAEREILGRSPVLSSNVLKVAHHGSDSSSTEQFLRAVAPADAVISASATNQWGFPHDAVLTRLTSIGATIWRTDRDGEVTATSDGVSVRVGP